MQARDPAPHDAPPPRLLALDVDGTLVDARGALRPAVREAVAAARAAGLDVVLCTGRRFRTLRPVLEELRLDGVAVVQNGVLVKDARSGRTLQSRALPRAVAAEAVALLREAGPPLVYVDADDAGPDFFTERPELAHAFQAAYLRAHAARHRVLPSLEPLPGPDAVVVSCMAEGERLQRLRPRLEAALAGRVRTNFLVNHGFGGHILEVVAAGTGKWAALRELAAERGVAPGEIAAVGDDENDAEMLAAAGLGIAMGNAVEAARRAADLVVASHDEDGAAAAVEHVLGRLDARA